MTQPRKEQVKSVNTKYTAGGFLGVPGAAEVVIPASTLNGFAVTDVPGGAEQDVEGYVLGTALSPFPVLAGDGIIVRIDGGPPFTVTFSSTDNSASRAAATINAAVSANIASNLDGRLLLKSLTFGASSSIQLADAFPGTLAKFGLAPGIYAGVDAPLRGILTRTPDLLGGNVQLALIDGRHLVTDSYETRLVGLVGGQFKLASSIPGGIPVHGRLSYDGTDYRLRFFVRFPGKPSVVTFNSSFFNVNNTDSFQLTVDAGSPFTVTFPNAGSPPPPPWTRDQIVARINAAYATSLGVAGVAVTEGTIPAPFAIAVTDSFTLVVDGTTIPITFLGSEVTATQVVARINLIAQGAPYNLPAPVAFVVGVGGSRIRLVSVTSGFGSSLGVYEDPGTLGSGTLRKLGLRPGLYRGAFVATPYGPDEIRISSQVRGSAGLLVVGGSGGTLAKLGLVAGSYAGSNEPREEPVPLPAQSVGVAPGSYSVDMIFPEVMDFGDISPAADSLVQEFLARSAGSNQALSMLNPTYLVGGDSVYDAQSRGVFDVGKPVTVGPDGSIPRGYLQGALDYADGLFKQFLKYPAGLVTAIVGNRFETTGFDGNPLPPPGDGVMNFFADPGDFSPPPPTGGATRGYRFYTGPNPPASSFSIRDDLSFAQEYPGAPGFVRLGQGRVLYSDTNNGGPTDSHGLKLADVYTFNVFPYGSGDGYIPFTGSTYDAFLRLGEFPIASGPDRSGYTGPAAASVASTASIVRSLNARHEITLGDGFYSAGDFTGEDALTQAQAWLQEMNIPVAVIKFKPGNYSINATLDFSFMQVLVLDSYYPQGDDNYHQVFINNNPGLFGTCITMPYVQFVVRNLVFSDTSPSDSGPRWFDGNTGHVRVEDTAFYGGGMRLGNPANVEFYKCLWRGDINNNTANTDQRAIFIDYDDTFYTTTVDRIVFQDCVMMSSVNGGIVGIRQYFASAQRPVYIQNLLFSRCRCYCSVNQVTAPAGATDPNPISSWNNFAGGTGILFLEPYGNVFNNDEGMRFKYLTIEQTEIFAGWYGAGSASVAINLMPSGWLGGPSWQLGVGFGACTLDNVTLRDVYVSDNGPAINQAPLVSIGGVGQYYAMHPSVAQGSLTVENLNVDVNFRSNGRPLMNMMPWFTKPDYPGSDYVRRGGAVCFSGWSLNIRDVNIKGSIAYAGSPDLFLYPYYRMTVDGVSITPAHVGIGTNLAPFGRVVVRNGYNPTWDIKNVFIFNEYDLPNVWSNDGIIVIEPGTNYSFGFYLSTAEANAYIRKRLSNFYILLDAVSAGGAAFAGIRMDCPTTIGDPFSTVTLPVGGSAIPKNGGIIIENGYVGAGNYPGNGTYYGIVGYINGMATDGTNVDNVIIRGVTVDSCFANGIHIDAGSLWYPVIIDGCTVYNCGQSGGYAGISVLSYMRNTFTNGFVNISRNIASFNNSTTFGVQINVRDLNSSTSPPVRAAFYGNLCYTGSNFSRINSVASATALLPAGPTSIVSGGIFVTGLETGYAGQTGGFTSFGNGILFTSGFRSMHNLAGTQSSQSPV